MEKIRIVDNSIMIKSVAAKWPSLIKKNRRYLKYCLAITLEADDADTLREHMQEVHATYLKKHPESAALPFAPFRKEQEDGLFKFELQNRQKPVLLGPDGTLFEGTIGEKSIVSLAVKAIGYSNSRTGVSLRVIGVKVIKAVSKADTVRELFGHSTLDDIEDDEDNW